MIMSDRYLVFQRLLAQARMAGVGFQPMARCSRIPKNPLVKQRKEDEKQEGGSLVQVLAVVEEDILQR